MLHAHNEEALLLFELVTRIAGRVKHYEAVAFFDKEAEYVQLQETVMLLCHNLLMVQIRIVCPKDSDKYGIYRDSPQEAFSTPWMNTQPSSNLMKSAVIWSLTSKV